MEQVNTVFRRSLHGSTLLFQKVIDPRLYDTLTSPGARALGEDAALKTSRNVRMRVIALRNWQDKKLRFSTHWSGIDGVAMSRWDLNLCNSCTSSFMMFFLSYFGIREPIRS